MYWMDRHFMVVLLTLNMVGCSTWTTTRAPLGGMEGKRVRVTTHEGDRIIGRLVRADSSGCAVVQHTYKTQNVVDTSNIASVERRKFSTGRTVGLVLGVTAVTFVCVGIAVASTMSGMGNISISGWDW